MERRKISSSDLASIGYEENSQILEIEFNNGAVYQYSGVSRSIYENLIAAASKGHYFNSNIKGCYPCIKID